MVLLSLASADNPGSFNVSAGYSTKVLVYEYQVNAITGSINVSGGGRDIYFTIQNYSGDEIYGRMIKDSGGFSHTFGQGGYYYLVYNNSFSSADKIVQVYYTTETPRFCYMFVILPGLLAGAFVLRR